MEFYFNVSLLLLLLLLLLSSCTFTSSSSEKSLVVNPEFHILDISNRLLKVSAVCNRTSTATATATGISNHTHHTKLEVVHKYGPCAPRHHKNQVHTTKLPSVAEILSQDQFRVKSIQTQLNPDSTKKNQLVNIPVQSGELLHNGDYIVRVGLGTIPKYVHLIFDTGSHVTWTQCEPCSQHCYKQHDNIFNPLKSTSYSNMSCIDRDCPVHFRRFPSYYNVTCTYSVIYGDESNTDGFLGKDTLALTRTDVLKKFIFGCGQNNTMLPDDEAAGVLGLSKHPLSLISQIAPPEKMWFSYYLPTSIDSTGYLTLGKNNDINESNVRFTPFVACPGITYDTLYCIKIISITIGKTKLQIQQSVSKTVSTLIDSGTTITHLPPTAYKAMRNEFNRQMDKKKYPIISGGYREFDTCYNINKHKFIEFPVVAFTFKGNVTVDIDYNSGGTLYVVNSSLACLAFIGNSNPKDAGIFGNLAQMRHEIVYDVSAGKLGFGPLRG